MRKRQRLGNSLEPHRQSSERRPVSLQRGEPRRGASCSADADETDRDQRIAIELINLPFLRTGGSVDEYRAGIERAIENGWLVRHESGTFVKFTQAGADLFA